MTEQLPGSAEWPPALFDAATAEELRRAVARLTAAQRLWLSGYLAGAAEPGGAVVAAAPLTEAVRPAVTVLYGSQSGNCERVARQIGDALTHRGVPHMLLDMLECQKAQLEQAQTLLVVVSTHGEGVPPDRALPLYEFLHGRKAPKLAQLKYSVLALGDSSYEKFCQTGRDFDARLEALGAQRLHARMDCDVEFEEPSQGWVDAVLGKLPETLAVATLVRSGAAPRTSASVSNAYTRKNPFRAPVYTNVALTARGSSKDVRHIELSLEGSSIHYEPGDAIGVVPRNDEAEVDALLAVLRFEPEAAVEIDAQTLPLRQALVERLDIGLLTRPLLERYVREAAAEPLGPLLLEQHQDRLRSYIHGRHLYDLVVAHPPAALDAAAFAKLLRPLAPRLYSVASSQRATPDEVHLTVSLVEYDSYGRRRRGVASAYLVGQDGDDAQVPIYLHRNTNFRLPADPDAPVIMIGPGTGVAPFRSFVAEREAADAKGRNWLFFGDRTFEADFLYQAEWLQWRKQGRLQRIDVAFSRDQDEKIYVQQRIRERGAEIWAWLQDGAHLYVCGEAEHMAPDVHHALRDILLRHGGLSEDAAGDYLVQLQRERRYQRDVY